MATLRTRSARLHRLPGGPQRSARAPQYPDPAASLIFFAALTALYCATAALYLVVPVVGRFGSVLLGSAVFGPDGVLNAGILEWGYRSLRSPDLRIFDWTAGFPLDNSLAVGENLIGWQILYTPLRLMGVGIPAAYNLLVLASLVVSGIGGALLAGRLGANRAGAALAGLVFAFGPFHLNHMLHLQTMAVCWSPFALLFLDRYLDGRSIKDATGLALAFIMSALSAIYFAVFLSLVLPLYAVLCWLFGRYRFDWRVLFGLVAAGAISSIALIPITMHYVHFAAVFGYAHDARVLSNFSMELTAPLRTSDWQIAWSWSPLVRGSTFTNARSFTPAFPGLVAAALAAYGIFDARRERESRRVMWILVALAIICWLLALGPITRTINAETPGIPAWVPLPGKLWLLVPGIRWPMRVFFFSWLCGAVLCGLGLSSVMRALRPQWRSAAAVAFSLLILVEYRPASWLAGTSIAVSEPMQLSDTYTYLAHERDRGGIVELPTADQRGWRTPASTRYVYGSAGHLRRVVAIHGSVMPPVIDTLLRAADALPQPSARDILWSHHVTRVVVHLSLMPEDVGRAVVTAFTGAGYRPLFTGREGVVFALNPP